MKLEVMKKWIGFDGTPTISIVYYAKHQNHTNIYNEGYIGVTYKKLEERKLQHLKEVKKGKRTHFKNALRTYGDAICWSIVCSNITELMSMKIEFLLRKSDGIGWNEVAGGGKPPKAKKGMYKNKINPNKGRTKDKSIYKNQSQLMKTNNPMKGKFGDNSPLADINVYVFFHKDFGEIITTRHEMIKNHGLLNSNISAVICGRRPHHKGWTVTKKVD